MALPPKRQFVFFGDNFAEFYNRQDAKVQARIEWTMDLVRSLSIVPENYFKHLTGTSLYEIRVSSGSDIYRILCFFDRDSIVVVLTGFRKSTQKTPRNEINKAIKLQDAYWRIKEGKDIDLRRTS